MDFSQPIGAVGGTSSVSSLYSDPLPAAPPPVAATPPAGSSGPPANAPQPPFSPAVANAPSPSPQAILADTKSLPANVLYAPSPPPGVDSTHHFDRKA